MKTVTNQNKRSYLSYLKLFSLSTLMLAMTMVNAACSKGGGGGPAPLTPIYGNYAGIGGVNGGSYAVGDYGNPSTPSVELTLAFTQAGGGYGGYGVGAAGVMYVQEYGICGLIPGAYSLQTAQPGQVGGNEVRGLSLIGQGAGGQVAVVINQAFITPQMSYGVDRQQYGLRMTSYGRISVQSMNGVCQSMNFY